MSSVLPTCPRCGHENARFEHVNVHTKRAMYSCRKCNKKFTEGYTASYTAPTGEPADNGKPELCNEQAELHDVWDALDLYCEPDFDNDDEYNSWVADEMRRDAWDEYYG